MQKFYLFANSFVILSNIILLVVLVKTNDKDIAKVDNLFILLAISAFANVLLTSPIAAKLSNFCGKKFTPELKITRAAPVVLFNSILLIPVVTFADSFIRQFVPGYTLQPSVFFSLTFVWFEIARYVILLQNKFVFVSIWLTLTQLIILFSVYAFGFGIEKFVQTAMVVKFSSATIILLPLLATLGTQWSRIKKSFISKNVVFLKHTYGYMIATIPTALIGLAPQLALGTAAPGSVTVFNLLQRSIQIPINLISVPIGDFQKFKMQKKEIDSLNVNMVQLSPILGLFFIISFSTILAQVIIFKLLFDFQYQYVFACTSISLFTGLFYSYITKIAELRLNINMMGKYGLFGHIMGLSIISFLYVLGEIGLNSIVIIRAAIDLIYFIPLGIYFSKSFNKNV